MVKMVSHKFRSLLRHLVRPQINAKSYYDVMRIITKTLGTVFFRGTRLLLVFFVE